MSLSSFLLKSVDIVDSELDTLFNAQPQPSVPITSSTYCSEPEAQPKKRRLAEQKSDLRTKKQKSDRTQAIKNEPSSKKRVSSSEEDEENSDLEASYLRFKEENGQLEEDKEATGDDDEGDGDASNLVHESLAGKSRSKSMSKKQKHVPPDETPARRDQRTIFIGNLTLEVAHKRPLQKQLQRHILSFIPTAKVESIRFRSVPFSSPTSTTPNASTEQPHKNPSQREHDRTRASSWRSSDATGSNTNTETKTYLSQSQKKKMLFLTHQFHTSGTTVHAYIVFAHPPPPSSAPRPTNLPPSPDIMNPYEAAKQAVKDADGTEFEGRVIRVDFVGKNAKGKAREEEGEKLAPNKAFEDADPKCTLFVGNLDLAAQEEDLRAFFENLMKTERGEPPEADAEGTMKKLDTWVTHVRIIRDKETQLGKGFAYVQFTDRECVDELLTLQPTQIKFAKRKLRVQRCKTLPGTKLSSSIKSSLKIVPSSTSTTTNPSTTKPKDSKPPHQRTAPTSTTPIIVPKGDPSLGTKLASMSKQERKAAKAADADRVARRLAKKKARMAMGTKKDLTGVGSGSGRGERRVRVRKGSSGGSDGAKEGRKKVRMRSERSLEKRNAKK